MIAMAWGSPPLADAPLPAIGYVQGMGSTADRTISWRVIVAVLAVLLAVALTFNWYNGREQDRNTDRLVEQIDS